MKYATVCSGIEAPSVAWEGLGWKPQWFSEIEKFPSALLAQRFPGVPNLGDMREVHQSDEFKRPIDVFMGGTPCQDFSCAGLGAGLDGKNGSLTLTFLEILGRLRPRWVVWENVPGVLSDDGGRTFGLFLGTLEKLGYGWAYRIIDAQYCGVPQRRRRVFVVGYLGNPKCAAAVLFERQSLLGNSPPSRKAREEIAGTLSARPTAGGGLGTDFGLGGGLQVARPLTTSNQRLDYETETLIAPPQSTVRTRSCARETDVVVTHALRGVGFDASEDGTGRGTPLTVHGSQDPCVTLDGTQAIGRNGGREACVFDPWQVTNKANRSQPTPGLCHTLPAAPAAPAAFGFGGVRRLMPIECERLQGFPDEWTKILYRGKPAKDGPRYKAIGNSIAVPVLKWIGERIEMIEAINARPKQEMDALDRSNACRAACEQLIKKLVSEWEAAYTADEQMWEALIQKNDPDHGRDEWAHKIEKKTLFRRLVSDEKLEQLVKGIERNQSYRDYFTKLFAKGEKPKAKK
jgi:DNA (cytosine-5)-methyltransferase 1